MRKNRLLVAVVVALVLIVGMLAVLVVKMRGSDVVAPTVANSSGVVSPSVSASASASSSLETYALADGSCATAEGVNYSDSSAVAQRFVEISFCFDSMVDRTMTAGMLRADGLMSQRLRESLVEPERNGLQRQWVLAQEHEAYTRPSVTEAATEPLVDPAGEARFEQKMVSWLWVGRDGASMDGGYASLELKMVEESGRWVVDAVQTNTFEAN